MHLPAWHHAAPVKSLVKASPLAVAVPDPETTPAHIDTRPQHWEPFRGGPAHTARPAAGARRRSHRTRFGAPRPVPQAGRPDPVAAPNAQRRPRWRSVASARGRGRAQAVSVAERALVITICQKRLYVGFGQSSR